jgi:hypothetical protein
MIPADPDLDYLQQINISSDKDITEIIEILVLIILHYVSSLSYLSHFYHDSLGVLLI